MDVEQANVVLVAELRAVRDALRPFAEAADRCDAERSPIASTDPEHGCTTFSYRTLDNARVALNRGEPC